MDFTLRRPNSTDATEVNDLVARCKPLDENSLYCNLLQCSHFADTSIIAESDGEIVGFISGYIVPNRNDRLFVWQVAVDEKARGNSLAKKMLLDILSRPVCADVCELVTTITPENKASQNVFKSLADALGAEYYTTKLFDKDEHFNGESSSEIQWRIGPFDL